MIIFSPPSYIVSVHIAIGVSCKLMLDRFSYGKTDTMSGTYPYPSGEELKPIHKAFDHFFATFQFTEHD